MLIKQKSFNVFNSIMCNGSLLTSKLQYEKVTIVGNHVFIFVLLKYDHDDCIIHICSFTSKETFNILLPILNQ